MRVISKGLHALRRFVRSDCGGSLAELAILIPFLAVMLAGVAEFGRLFQTQTTLTKATRTAARYLSNHQFNDDEKDKARSLVVCGKLTCAGGDELVKGMTTANVCIEPVGTPATIETVTVRIPKTAGDCGAPHMYVPIFDIGALLDNDAFSLNLPLSAGTTMRYMLD